MIELRGASVVVTGGGHGIGRALAEAMAGAGARVTVADLSEERAARVADRIGGRGVACDVAARGAVFDLVAGAEAEVGPVAVFCSNAGIGDQGPDLGSSPQQIERIVAVNLLAHVWAAQAVVPGMVERGGGALVQTLSSAALITGPSGMGYTLTKHGGLGFAEWVDLNYRHLGITVTCLCPNAVNTGMLGRDESMEGLGGASSPPPGLGDVIEPEECARLTLEAMAAGRFLVLPHPRVGESFARKAGDYDRWLEGTNRRLRRMRGEDV
jgi:NAD(P)-dependent dehydrogenase (short-subunit alcohol dehydrogenase family)